MEVLSFNSRTSAGLEERYHCQAAWPPKQEPGSGWCRFARRLLVAVTVVKTVINSPVKIANFFIVWLWALPVY